eukprot:Hpha_TRINITY_DN321_c0_g1::TRINITY_DN321_c0_g1_i1::g.112674::m.112674/K04874/KCNA1; potassium voltage-gated channel Shaker-related subfamily A member 1
MPRAQGPQGKYAEGTGVAAAAAGGECSSVTSGDQDRVVRVPHTLSVQVPGKTEPTGIQRVSSEDDSAMCIQHSDSYLYSGLGSAVAASGLGGQARKREIPHVVSAIIPAKSLAARVDTNAHEKHFTWRQRIFCLVDPAQPQPSQMSAHVSTVIATVIFVTILVSVLTLCLESLPENYHGNDGLRVTETICVALFSLEICAKLVGIEPHVAFWKDGFNYVDIVAVLPFYIELATQGGAVNLVFLRVVRLARVFRMLKLGQYSRPLQMVILVLQNSVDAVGLLVFLLFVCTVLFSSLVWLAEQQNSHFDEVERVWIRSDGLASLFQSIPGATWWCYCTLTTVGYGEVWPMGGWGKLVGSVCMIVGLFVVAFPVILISYHYAELEREMISLKLGYEPGTFCIECNRPMVDILSLAPGEGEATAVAAAETGKSNRTPIVGWADELVERDSAGGAAPPPAKDPLSPPPLSIPPT